MYKKLISWIVCVLALSSFCQNAIEDYVSAEDQSYSWQVVETVEGEKTNTVWIDMVSQHWLTAEEIDEPEWRHWLILTVPKELGSDTALLVIGGGANNRDKPGAEASFANIATFTSSVVAELHMVPNQPRVFHGDGVERTEDDLIAYAWQHYLTTQDVRYLPRGPMVKSAVRAMDTISAYIRKTSSDADVSKFVVAGGSKRGWTTWLTGALDDRVAAIVPIVIDVLDVPRSMDHHFAAYGYWASSIGNYVEHRIMTARQDPRLAEIYALVDPIMYVDQLKMPKLVLNAAGDQFFLPDSSQFYWDQLKGPKYLRYVPNGDHSLRETDGIDTLSGFFALTVANKAPPSMTWTTDQNNVVKVSASTTPVEALLWVADNPRTRDFRVASIGRAYVSTPLEPDEDGNYMVTLNEPPSGWRAAFIEFAWDMGLPVPFKLSTEVFVRPDVLPFADKKSDLPSSITMKCNGLASQKDAVLALGTELNKQSNFASSGLKAEIDSGDLYINWTPSEEFRKGYYIMGPALQKQGCEQPAFQLESGPNITLPPVAASDSP